MRFNLPAPTASVVSTLLSPPSLLALRCPSPTEATFGREIWVKGFKLVFIIQKYITYKELLSILYCTAESGLNCSLFFKNHHTEVIVRFLIWPTDPKYLYHFFPFVRHWVHDEKNTSTFFYDLKCRPPGVGLRIHSNTEHWCRIKGPCVQPRLVGSFSSVKSPPDLTEWWAGR